MEVEGVHHDGLICCVYPQSQSIILALVLFSIGMFPTLLLCRQPQSATVLYLWGWKYQRALDI